MKDCKLQELLKLLESFGDRKKGIELLDVVDKNFTKQFEEIYINISSTPKNDQ